ncbi:MAG: hypothetical protein IJ561_01395 [Ruminococcus sp.]|nr:hypothetical protein [Ruminococcus sp.]
MEKLLVYAYLWRLGLSDGQEYNEYLDMLFLKGSDNQLLLELELLSDAESALMRLKRYFDYETKSFDEVLFGKALFSELGNIYHSQKVSITLFAQKCYELYNMLPAWVNAFEMPYNVLSYIDDMIEYNSLQEFEETIEKMLSYYSPEV